jgi:tetratricopeptide (TPR) repeat protein
VGEPDSLAWSQTQLGKLYWSNGRIEAAAREFRAALRVRSAYAPALDGLAQVEAARGRHAQAVALARRASEILPLPQYVAAYGDLLHGAVAARQYELVAAIARLERARGVNVDLEIALFNVDHRIRLGRTLALARLAQEERPSIDGDDVLAWALARTGHCEEALHYSRLALRLGTRDAAKFFHRGVIERCLGHPAAARTWFVRSHSTNPYWRHP